MLHPETDSHVVPRRSHFTEAIPYQPGTWALPLESCMGHSNQEGPYIHIFIYLYLFIYIILYVYIYILPCYGWSLGT